MRPSARIAARGHGAFRALHELVTRSEYDALGEDFEKQALGIYDLSQLTPR